MKKLICGLTDFGPDLTLVVGVPPDQVNSTSIDQIELQQ